MNKFIILTLLFSITSCSKKNEDENIKPELKNAATNSITIVKNYENLISKYQPHGDEGWLDIISPNLIFTSDIETNRNQPFPERGAYQCSLSTSLIRLSDGKNLEYSDIFSAQENKVADAILEYIKTSDIDISTVDRKALIDSIKNLNFKEINKNQFNYISYEYIADSCDSIVFEKAIPISIIQKFLTKWISQQLQLND